MDCCEMWKTPTCSPALRANQQNYNDSEKDELNPNLKINLTAPGRTRLTIKIHCFIMRPNTETSWSMTYTNTINTALKMHESNCCKLTSEKISLDILQIWNLFSPKRLEPCIQIIITSGQMLYHITMQENSALRLCKD